ncbi:hypothetical protein K5M33_14055 [Chromobacterium vaccinii]|nr:hypothetical protein [Chromobacterium vaccinii]MBX9357847.1 hypothetical protein [Chromobacterium vaccinii]
MNSNNPITAQLLITMLADGSVEVTRTGNTDALLTCFNRKPHEQPTTAAAPTPQPQQEVIA